ncbi:DUF3040 domain-containing protein [Nocardioides jishulii]|uniref:DUF3040 domain-containing protein n=1 Tax=Nocardioides jishulii TaxID=2575440 RepID=A0A4U2YM24_9ACTN|nr:DUF3040 domain-containing protein [Nocardioides jishulii]QCX27170.1 DUF3040 domain-containing protein [Nocardioides jishulii]TKI61655.1 DUF3040 domain-containing protein [Nocardioides jishulii]
MPLSEEELRLLEQMERALVEEDPKFAHTLRGTGGQRASRRRAIIAGVVFAVGVVVLMTGAIAAMPVVGVAGFVVMLVSATVAVTALRAPSKPEPAPLRETPQGFGVVDGGRRGRATKAPRASRSRHSFVERMDERWRRRRDGY